MSALGLQNLTFQFKLFVNNGTKFGAPGNRTPAIICHFSLQHQRNLKNTTLLYVMYT